jgi:hypothetical protein
MFFIIGMRRSGTSILMDVIQSHPQIGNVEFEPHPLWYAVEMSYFSRFKYLDWVNKEMHRFTSKEGLHGAKFALNSGTKALEWVMLKDKFKDAKFIFITRNEEDVWKSLYRLDKDIMRGVVSHEEHLMSHTRINNQFEEFVHKEPERAVIVSYEGLRQNPDGEMEKVWQLLGVNNHSIKGMIR